MPQPKGLRLGDPDDHDPLAVQRALTAYRGPLRQPCLVHVTNPADRARIVQLAAEGELTRTQAARLLHCSGSAINAYLTELALITMETAA
ncbi:hypothetical protein [Tsukamurella pseudospumae]|uniref:RNA polymerase sigma factor 70 region 4 type 2 domain-containing protein n=1 Tax=Tsukamurella pseudospumae TaxID=239498 RepID=A0A137ZRR9_9ACTN|nr:hypothetical protein [Tsukamurella pseudospumae]KXP00870.1 hypothetical protein AXK61_12740 [Tsukamurella pseudospumae]